MLLLGHGVLHLRAVEGGWHWSAPEEVVARVAPELPGDPFRIGMMLMMLAVGDSPYGEEPIMRREWSLTQSEHLVELGPVVDLLETLLHLDSVDRPRGELLHRLLAEAAPVPWRAYVAKAAKGQ